MSVKTKVAKSTAPAAEAVTTDTVLKEIKGLQQRMEPALELLKILEQPSRRAGMSPTELIAKMTAGGNIPVLFGGDGSAMSSGPVNRTKSIGWGPMLENLWTLANRSTTEIEKTKAANVLFKAAKEGGFGVQKAALSEGSGVTGGYTIPPQFSNQLLTLAGEEAFVEPRCSSVPLSGLTMTIPALDVTTAQGAGNSPFLGGVKAYWTADTTTRQETEPTFRDFELKAHELAMFCVASNNLLADSAVALDALLSQLFAAAVVWYTEYAYLQGDGVGKPIGVLNSPATIQVTRNTSARFKFPDVANMIARMYLPSWRGGKALWVMHQSVLPDLLQLNDGSGGTAGTGRPVFLPLDQSVVNMPGQSAGPASIGTILGIPVVLTEKLPPLGTTGCVALIDFSKYMLGKRADITIEVSPHTKFLNNQMVWRVIWRGDGQPWLNSAITLADGSTTVSPFIILTQ